MLKILVSVLFSFFLITGLSAQDEEPEVEIKSSDVENFIKEFPSIKTEFDKLQIKYDNEDYELTLPEGVEIVEEINSVVKKHGYTDYTDFYMKAGTILSIYAAIKMETESEDAEPEIQQAIDEIENNPYYTAEQKEQMILMLKQGMSAMQAATEDMSDSENVKVVKPYTDEIEKMLEED